NQQEAHKQPELTEEERESMERQVAEIKAQLAARNEVQA
ncbi:DnaD domain protein, partial [Listeria monocytogenes]|nr:DnaD domain protein [Listeria monocytogenes]